MQSQSNCSSCLSGQEQIFKGGGGLNGCRGMRKGRKLCAKGGIVPMELGIQPSPIGNKTGAFSPL